MKGDRFFTVIVSLFTVLLSSVLSYIISNRSITRSAITDSQREALQKDSPILNKVFELSGECDLVILAFVEQVNIREGLITHYMAPDSTIVRIDTTYTKRVEYDTTYCRIPKFIYDKESFTIVKADLDYISSHIDELSFKTYKQINDLLAFVKKHPICLVESIDAARNSEWSTMRVHMTFYKKINDITGLYYQRLNEYGLKE